MWLDNASDIDVLFYEPYADVISEIALNKEYKPLTIGIFGVWGAGKSTLLKLIENKVLGENTDNSETRTICININAWMFEGYEDAKVAMMESLLQELDNKAPEPLKKKFKALLKKTDRFKLSMKALGFSAPLLAALVKGNVLPIIQGIIQGLSSLSEKQIADGVKEGSKAAMEVKDSCMTEEQDDTNLVHNVRTFRNEFEEALSGQEINNVVVLIDDLDRCQPDRIIETLEAIKLFCRLIRSLSLLRQTKMLFSMQSGKSILLSKVLQ